MDYILDTQDFDQGAAAHLFTNPNHVEIDLSEYANAGSKGAYVNKLDCVVLSALEIDTKFNVITGSDGVLRGAPGGHPDTAAGSKCCIIVTPLTRGRMATVCKDVVTVTTPGDCVDVLVTDYGIAINPLRSDISRMVFTGEPTEEMRGIYALVDEAQKAAQNAAKLGAWIPDVGDAARGILRKAGYADFLPNRVGHGIGCMTHEGPGIKGSNSRRLEVGMAFSIEPGIYLPGRYGMRIESIVIINENGGDRDAE